VGLYAPTCWVILSDRRTGGIIIDEKYDTSTPTGRLQKVLAELLAASTTLESSQVLECAFTALDTVSSWELEECIDIDDLIRELEIEAEYHLDKAATRRAEEALEMQQLQLFGTAPCFIPTK
jgi:hypothetical protein